jgi:hypothetical protein
MNANSLDELKTELSIKAKNGVDFIAAATVVWALIAFIWTLPQSSYNKSVFTFMIGAVMLPLAFALSKVFKTEWTVKDNPLQSLGLWLNFAQLFYFPFLVFVLLKIPDYFVMTYAIITGAHFFPYAWYYKTFVYAIAAGVIAVGSLVIALVVDQSEFFWIPTFVSVFLLITSIALLADYKRKKPLARN